MSDRLPRIRENDGVTNPQTGKALRGFERFWDAAMRAIEARLQAITDGIVVAINGQAVTRSIVGGPGIEVTNGSGVAGDPTITALGPDGFGFFVGGIMTNGELLGMGVFDKDISFPSTANAAVVKSLFPATASAVFTIKAVIAGVDTQVGTITFSAGGTDGVVVWTSNPYVLTSGTPLKLFAPVTHDTTLSMVTAIIPGDLAA